MMERSYEFTETCARCGGSGDVADTFALCGFVDVETRRCAVCGAAWFNRIRREGAEAYSAVYDEDDCSRVSSANRLMTDEKENKNAEEAARLDL